MGEKAEVYPVQDPAPGSRLITLAGDTVRFTLTANAAIKGTGWLRTNLGAAAARRRDIVDHVDRRRPILDRDWHDIPMHHAGDGRWSLTLALADVGRFEAKAYLLPEDDPTPRWPGGANVVLRVEPPETAAANGIYTVFVRQFGPNLKARAAADADATIARLDAEGYSVIPRAGRFRDVMPHLDLIIGTMGFRYLHLLPIHPVPTTYARMGRFGSPFAPLNLRDVDPAMAVFDRVTTPLDQFVELVDAVHARGARILLDLPANHTGWASNLQIEHPEWFKRTGDRRFKSPGAWGVTWEDLSELNYDGNPALWRYMAEVFRFWCGHGVDGFRCDAGYMVPLAVWEYITARVRDEYPETVFLLEGLGGHPETVRRLLDQGGMNWAYSELFQVMDRPHMEAYLPGAVDEDAWRGLLVHFAETHDNDRLAARSETFARMRATLAALASRRGGFGITNGVEWFAEAKLDVHEATPLNWGAARNMVDDLARLNALLRHHPAFGPAARIDLVPQGKGSGVVIRRVAPGGSVLAAVNLDAAHPTTVAWPTRDAPADLAYDLLGDRPVAPRREGDAMALTLAAGECLCLAAEAWTPPDADRRPDAAPAVVRQRARAEVAAIMASQHGPALPDHVDLDAEAAGYANDPPTAWARLAADGAVTVSRWHWPRDVRRVVPIPTHHAVWFEAAYPFELAVTHRQPARRRSITTTDGRHGVLLPPDPDAPAGPAPIRLRVFAPDGCRCETADVHWVAARPPRSRRLLCGEEIRSRAAYAILANRRGALVQARGQWGQIESRYDALLAANPDPAVPADRRNLFTRCRAWVVYQGYSRELGPDCLLSFARRDGSLHWVFEAPVGRGCAVTLDVALHLDPNANRMTLAFTRRPCAASATPALDDRAAVRLILRPDIEDRCAHDLTKAYTGPEQAWPAAVTPCADGFRFAPYPPRALTVALTGGRFVVEPEWHYMVRHPHEAQRGLDDASDLFSPGYLAIHLAAGDAAVLTATAETGGAAPPPAPAGQPRRSTPAAADRPLREALREAMDDFVADRDGASTLIAGYPWFLDWGRDTLIALRGFIAAERFDLARDILTAFASLEADGTLPNMIHAHDHANRDTSDAPLWLIAAAADLAAATRDPAVLAIDCGGRSLRAVVRSIIEHYRDGTPNGIRMDPESGLIYSPAHFTWMDTNHPAGTPRQGYPIEIQALWHHALSFAAAADAGGPWTALADRVRASIHDLFRLPADAGPRRRAAGLPPPALADCLHAQPGQRAAQAVPDDHIRPNQLLAITLGAVDDPVVTTAILAATEGLLTPGAIRSLDDRPVTVALPVIWRGRSLNDPQAPFQPCYGGDEDTSRKPAYHNGTAWTWLFPSYAEALVRVHGIAAQPTAMALLSAGVQLMDHGCLGQLPEIVDGGAPHAPRGCGAQAWAVTEFYRVLAMLTETA